MDQAELQELILPALYVAAVAATPIVTRIVTNPTFPNTVNNVATNVGKAWRWVKN